MSQKKDNVILLLSLLITLGLIGLGAWWFFKISGAKIDNISSEQQNSCCFFQLSKQLQPVT
ncbi:hypothetical protein CK510_25245 [Brunnivagina elsteri CCALA 953]|uniref:Uncharacterized protein n=1 Tax=Brunnivagina elsteri CCALA 953 TaxID=987040 RepID=A0A2A2TD55_9CYAN|nr:hypothetical protein CK510_25245 [Calothrix elsteri CCALA 953]